MTLSYALLDFLADGLVAGVGAVVAFLPQIALLFGLLYLLEDIGYMARAAFVVDQAVAQVTDLHRVTASAFEIDTTSTTSGDRFVQADDGTRATTGGGGGS